MDEKSGFFLCYDKEPGTRIPFKSPNHSGRKSAQGTVKNNNTGTGTIVLM